MTAVLGDDAIDALADGHGPATNTASALLHPAAVLASRAADELLLVAAGDGATAHGALVVRAWVAAVAHGLAAIAAAGNVERTEAVEAARTRLLQKIDEHHVADLDGLVDDLRPE